MIASRKNVLIEKRWALTAIVLGFLLGFISAFICVKWNLVIFGFNIMYIISPLIAGFVEIFIARRKYGKSTGAISALLTFILINLYGWVGPGWIIPKQEPVTLSFITLIALILTVQAAFPTATNYFLFVVGLGTFTRIIGFLVSVPTRIQRKLPEVEGEEEITKQADEIFLDELTIPIVSVPDVEGGEIKKYVGLVMGEAIAEEKKSEGRLSKLSKITRPTQLDDMNLGEARMRALSQMLEKAESMGANAVVEVLIDYVSMGGLQGSATIVTATGTAVIVQEENSNLTEKESKESSKSGISEKIKVFRVGKKVSGGDESISVMGEKTEVKVRDSVSKDDVFNRIDQFVNEKRDQITKNWELATKNDVVELENRYSKVSKDVSEFDERFEEEREYTNKKINKIEDRLEKLEVKKNKSWQRRKIYKKI